MPTYESLPAQSPFFKGILFQKMAQDLRLAGLAKRTVYGYLRAVRQLADYSEKSPDQLDEQDLRKFLLHLIVELEVASGTQSVALSGIKFFFGTTLPRDWQVLKLTKLRSIEALPEVITRQQVNQLIGACRTVRLRTFFWVTYTLGLRIGEAVNLQVGDIDSQRMSVHIHRGKQKLQQGPVSRTAKRLPTHYNPWLPSNQTSFSQTGCQPIRIQRSKRCGHAQANGSKNQSAKLTKRSARPKRQDLTESARPKRQALTERRGSHRWARRLLMDYGIESALDSASLTVRTS